MARKVTAVSKADILVRGATLSSVLVSGLVVGGLVFAIILMTHFSVLFGGRALKRLGRRPLFRAFVVGDNKAYGTSSTMKNIYSCCEPTGSSTWADYEYSGRMMLTDAGGGIGVIFLGSRGRGERFYGLRRNGQGDTLFVSGSGTKIIGKGQTDTELSPETKFWYRFKVEAEDSGDRTQIRAKVWKEGSPEPVSWQIACFDEGPRRNVRGFVGVWASSKGEKYFDDLSVKLLSHKASQDQFLLQEDFERFSLGAHSADWNDRIAPVDFSEVVDRLSDFFRMNLLDFAGPWDEVVDLGAIALTFCSAGLLGGIARNYRARLRHSTDPTGRKWRIPVELVPFVSIFVYAGAMKGVVLPFYAGGGICAGYLWRFLHTAVLKLFRSSGVKDSVPDAQRKCPQ